MTVIILVTSSCFQKLIKFVLINIAIDPQKLRYQLFMSFNQRIYRLTSFPILLLNYFYIILIYFYIIS